MTTLDEIVDEFYINKRTSSPRNFDLFLKGVNSGLTRTASSKRAPDTRDYGRTKQQRLGAQLFERRLLEEPSDNNAHFKDGVEFGERIKTVLNRGNVTEENIQKLFDESLENLPPGERPVELPRKSRLRALFSSNIDFNPDAPLTEKEVMDAKLFYKIPPLSNGVASSSKHPRYQDVNFDALSIEQLTTETFKEFVDQDKLVEFLELTTAESDSPLPTKAQLSELSEFFVALNRGDAAEDRQTIIRKYIVQCKTMEQRKLFGEATARKYVYFLLRAFENFNAIYNDYIVEEEAWDLDIEGELSAVEEYATFLGFWRLEEAKRQLQEKVALDNRLWNNVLDLSTLTIADIKFYGRFVRGVEGEYSREDFLRHVEELGFSTTLPRSPIDFPVERTMNVIEGIGRKAYETMLPLNMMSWLVEGDDALRFVIHDVVMLRYCIRETLLRMHYKNTLKHTNLTEFASRRSFLAYLVKAERTLDAKDIINNYVQSVSNGKVARNEDEYEDDDFKDDKPKAHAAAASSSRRVYDDDDDDDEEIYGFGEDDDSDIGQDIEVVTYPRPLESRLNQNIIVRPASHRDRDHRYPVSEAKVNLYHVTAHIGCGVGKHVGYASYDSKANKIVDLDYSEDRVREALIGAIQEVHPRCQGKVENIGANAATSSSSSSTQGEDEDYTLTLNLSYDYESLLAETGQTNERPHILMLWLSSSYSSTDPIVINVEKVRKSRRTFTFKVNRNYIPTDVSLNVDSYSHFTSETGNPMRNLAGSSYVPLAELVSNLGAPVTLNLRVAASDVHVTKARLTLRCNSSTLPVENSDNEDDDPQSTCALIKNYIADNHRFYDNHPPISRSIAHTTVFKFRCRQNYVPGVLFDSFRLPRSQEAYYLNALKNALQLRLPQAPITNIEEAWERVDSKLYTVLSMLTSYAVACKYLRDSVDNNVKGAGQWDVQRVEEIDSFDTVRHTDNGDCEDKTKEILLHVMELKYNSKEFTSPVFAEIRSILDNYVFCSTLCAVSQSSISKADFDARHEILDAHLSAHECAVAIPNYTFFSALRRSSPTHKLFDLYTREEQERGRGDRLYILEGTGSLAPEPRDSTEYRDEIQFAYEKAIPHHHLTGQIFYDIDSDDIFYKIIVNLMTPEFYLRTGYIGFEFLVVNEKGQRGAFFSDLMNITDSRSRVMITETPRLSPLAFNRSMRVMDDNFPLLTLEAPLEIPRAILRTAERLTFRTNEKRKVIPRHEDCCIVQCLFEYMTEAKIVSIIKGAQAQRLNVVCYVEALKLDYVTKQVFGRYTLIFY